MIICIYIGCEAKKLWFLIRHGTRNPTTKKIETMINDLPKIQEAVLNNCRVRQCHLTEEQRKSFADWKLTITNNEAALLVTEGENELIGLAERYQSRFPELMPEEYSNDTYKVF